VSVTSTPADADAPIAALATTEATPRRSLLRSIFATVEGRVGLPLCVAMLLLILLGSHLAPYSPTEIGTGIPASAPSGDHLLGTDELGRDVLSRLLSGGTSVLLVPLASVVLAFLVGGAIGMFAAYRRGGADQVISRTFDLLLAMPPLLVVLVLIVGLGTSQLVLVLTVGLVFIPWVGRLMRGSAQAVVTSEYVQAAVARGERTTWILRKEILPNIAAPLIGAFSLYLTSAIVFVATLSFLGLGEQPPSSSWGLMVAQSRGFIDSNPWGTLAPALAIALLSVSFTLVADAVTRHVVRDADEERPTL
jgi:peptide/nickel transport system permease protein